VWKNFKNMPLLLKFLTAHSLSCFFFIIGSIIPHNSFSINGVHVSYAQWWQSGAGILTSIVGLILPVGGYLILKQHRLARIVYLSALMIGLTITYIPLKAKINLIEPLISTIILLILMACYLYFRKSVILYFCSNKDRDQRCF